MKGYEIVKIIGQYPLLQLHFFGVFSIDFLQKIATLPTLSFAVCNISSLQEEGVHWFVIYRDSYKNFQLFDSEGRENTNKLKALLRPVLLHTQFVITYNKTRYQPVKSVNCGYFAIYFAVQKLHNLSVRYSMLLNSIFSQNCRENEKLIKKNFSL